MQPPRDDGEDHLNADIDEFTTHDRKGGWARALLIARRVEPDEGHGASFEQQSKRFGRNVYRRISAREFARRSGAAAKRILAFYRAWERAAADGIVPPAHELAPGVHVDLPDEADVPFFGEHGYYRSYDARLNMKEERRQAIEAEADRVGVKPSSPLFIAEHPGALTAAVVADASARSAARKGIEEFERRQEAVDAEDRAAAGRAAEEPFGPDQAAPDASAGGTGAVDVEQAVRAVSRHRPETDVALQVFTELSEVRLATLRALSLLQRHQVQFTGDRSQAITDLCTASEAAIAFIRDLAAGPYTALNDHALQAFLDESERKLR
ncbi:hypothetical protein [Streptomyces luteolus]|uniref:Uncharacterized protein n=1 Tax=Streptomyces luteolus TaxID=3043615 RepID=A0ABT6SYI9_9ACTN|nr:hypothetical protein [Streptomyces sp. B-S-A12]MDI3420440.1 hypothetical protein [Streptomyces sp. B-S-A12]